MNEKYRIMRTSEIKQKIGIAHDHFKYEIKDAGGNTHRLLHVSSLKTSFLALIGCGFFTNDDIDEGLIRPIIQSDESVTYLSYSTGTIESIKTSLEKYRFLITVLFKWYDNRTQFVSIDDPNEEIINIKLPTTKSFDDLSKVTNELKNAFSNVVSEFEGGKVEIKRFEEGSLWVIVSVGTALALVSSLVWSGAVVAKKILEVRNAYEIFRNASQRNDLMEELNKVVEEQTRSFIEIEAKLIQDEYFSEKDKKNDKEHLKRIEFSLKNISELILKGTKIEPALAASENVKNLFPDYKNLQLLESRQKKINQ